ncbi:histidine--tRNA ligase [Patescibacteria group bacterium]|nr:histidine--tRNA ligase [Patescibacteria group bacterium]MBU1916435.1 histidine--tRNA ligase [Patescibacteria group bacterium]
MAPSKKSPKVKAKGKSGTKTAVKKVAKKQKVAAVTAGRSTVNKKAAPAAPTAAVASVPRIKGMPQSLRGMKDTLPLEQKFWRRVKSVAEALAQAYGFECIDTPILEMTSLFVRSAGTQTDVIEKEMFSFIDRGGDNVTLRPEGTAPVVRAYVNHGMVNLPQPVKLYYIGPMFRYERPQQGRYRQHHQFGVEVFGDDNPILDAEVALLAYLFYKELGISSIVRINSLGCNECRPTYREELINYFRPKRSQLCDDCKRRLSKNPLRLLDCKEEGCAALKDEAPQLVDSLDDSCKEHLMRVLEYLDDLQVPYVLDPHLVRGFDYYTRTVFELIPEDGDNKTASLGGGGRYDNLVEQLGGRPTPACGFGIGLERAILQMKAQEIDPPDDSIPDVFVAQLGDSARRKAFALFEELRDAGLRIAGNFTKNSLKAQLEIANRLGAKYTVILGQQEVIDETILIRDMESGMQEIVDYKKAVSDLKKKIVKS